MKQTVEQILNYLGGSGWDEVLYRYWTEDFVDVLEELKRLSDEGKHFTPALKKAFRWMKETPYNDIKVALLGEGHSIGIISATGIPFSQSHAKLIKPEFIGARQKGLDMRISTWKAANELVKPLLVPSIEYMNYDLSIWCRQGVLMIPYAVTTRINGDPHNKLWNGFRSRVIDSVNNRYKNIPWLLVGSNAIKYEDLIESKYTIPIELFPELTDNKWPEKVNTILLNQNKTPILWNTYKGEFATSTV